MADLTPEESKKRELTDEETFRLVVEGFAQVRPENKQRRTPRFPTPGALSSRLGVHGFEGNLVLEDFDFNDHVGRRNLGSGRNGNGEPLGINIIDFSEAGVQLQFQCDDFLRLKESRLYLELQNQRFPVTLMWFQKSGPVSKGGFSFNTAIHSDLYLARIASTLNVELVDFLVSTYGRNPTAVTVQSGIFIYMSIFYGLRLRFMEAVAEVNTLRGWIESPATNRPGALPDACHLPYTNMYNTDQIRKYRSDPRIRKLLYHYLKPFYEFGCGIVGLGHRVIFLRKEALATIFNSVFIATEDCEYAPAVFPSLSFLYQSFQHLKHLFPDILGEVLGEAEFDAQFRYYSSIISRVQQLPKTFFDLPAAFEESMDLFQPRWQEA